MVKLPVLLYGIIICGILPTAIGFLEDTAQRPNVNNEGINGIETNGALSQAINVAQGHIEALDIEPANSYEAGSPVTVVESGSDDTTDADSSHRITQATAMSIDDLLVDGTTFETDGDAMIAKYGLKALFQTIKPTTSTSSQLHTKNCKSLLDSYDAETRKKLESSIPDHALCARLRRPLCETCADTVDIAVTIIESQFLWKVQEEIVGDFTQVALDARGVGFSGPFGGSWSDHDAAKSVFEGMTGQKIEKSTFEVGLKKRLQSILDASVLLAKKYKGPANEVEKIWKHVGYWEQSNDVVAVANAVWGLYRVESGLPLSIWGCSADGPLAELVAYRNAARIKHLVSESPADLLAFSNHTKGYIESGSDGWDALHYFAAYCHEASQCGFRRGDTPNSILSRNGVLKVLKSFFEDESLDGWVQAFFHNFNDGARMPGQSFLFLSNWLTHALSNPDFKLEKDQGYRVGKSTERDWSSVTTSHQGISVNDQSAFPSLNNPFVQNCLDMQDFGIKTDSDSLLQGFQEAQQQSPVHAFKYTTNWIFCVGFQQENMKSEVSIPVDRMEAGVILANPGLFISQDRDVATPRKYAEAASVRFPGSKAVFQKEVLGHGLVNQKEAGTLTHCMRNILREYFNTGALPTVDYCEKEVPPGPTFKLPFGMAKHVDHPFDWPDRPEFEDTRETHIGGSFDEL
ncbi:hypothetical protein BJ508DRAFT_335944 [Ascobolus immersus RN42]|uniref:Peptidase S33 tripeptidyl aminopeptidase-like C-terminal domain-containing protein n=1 Tax=Ascobolus immersus RN42 TaxID=1160509 RepID=A0A3N4HEA2_ASCIM|nr:hypothetical protein BJ508DRAFT_335944 [Ascobolus immersus RN42]